MNGPDWNLVAFFCTLCFLTLMAGMIVVFA
jgi:hypothetical protein